MFLIPHIEPDKVLIDNFIMILFQTIFYWESQTLSFKDTDAITDSSNAHLTIFFDI